MLRSSHRIMCSSDHRTVRCLSSPPCAAVQMLARSEPRRLKINGRSDTLKRIGAAADLESGSDHTLSSRHNSFKDGKYLVTSPRQAGKECSPLLRFVLIFPPVALLILRLLIQFYLTFNALWRASNVQQSPRPSL